MAMLLGDQVSISTITHEAELSFTNQALPDRSHQAKKLASFRDEVDSSTFLVLNLDGNSNPSDNTHQARSSVDKKLSGFRDEVDSTTFLGLNLDGNNNPCDHTHPGRSSVIKKLASFRDEVDSSTFLGLNLDGNNNPSDHTHPGRSCVSKKQASFCDEVDSSTFLGLNLDGNNNLSDHTQQGLSSDDKKLVSFHEEVDSSTFPELNLDGNNDCMHHASKKRKPDSDQGKAQKRKKVNYPQVPTINLSSEFLRIIGDGVPTVFLYRKKLETSDILQNQNRLLITRTKKLMYEFLTGEERGTLVGRKGVSNIDVVGVDKTGREFEMRLTKWGNEKITINFNHNWYKMAYEANGARVGHWVDLWGYRRQADGKICVAVNFSI